MEPLTFKIITDADDSGVRRYEKSLGGVDVTSRKASSAIKGFVGDLQNAQSVSDVTSSALNALTKILGTSLAATGVVVVGKLLVDAFNKVNDAVKESTKSVEEANKQISKIAMAGPSFETASKSAEVLNKTADGLRKNLEKINESKFQSFIGGITGAIDKLKELIFTTEKQANEQARQAIVQKLIELERLETSDDITRSIAEQQKVYQELIILAREAKDIGLENEIIQRSQAKARKTASEEQAKLDAKLQEDRKKAEEKRIKEIEKLEEQAAAHRSKIFDAEEKARESAYKIEAQFIESVRKKEAERAEEIDKQLDKIDKRKKDIKEEIELLTKRNAEEAAGFGGSSRAPGARPTSFETGLETKLLRERYKDIAKRDKEYFDGVADRLKKEGRAYDKWAVQKEVARMATENQTSKINASSIELRELASELNRLESESRDLKSESARLSESLSRSRDHLSEFGQSLLGFSSAFEIPSQSLVDDSLAAAAGLSDTGESANMISDIFGSTGTVITEFGALIDTTEIQLTDFGTKLKEVLPEPAGGGPIASEDTLQKVLTELKETLTQLRTYAHAT